MSVPLESVRADTPGVDHVVHLDNAGSALPTRGVLDTVMAHLELEARRGGYAAAREASGATEAVLGSVAALVGGEAESIALTESATVAWNSALHAYPFSPGQRVLTSRAEYASNAITLLQLGERHGIETVLIEDDEEGQVSLEHLESELGRGAEMVCLTHIPTAGGLVNPAEAVGELCRRHGAFYVLDACQSVGQVPLDVSRIGCDVLSATGRKYLRAPRGTGFLWLGERAMDLLRPSQLDLFSATWVAPERYEVRSDARRFEFFEHSVAGRLGLGAACDYALALGVESTWERVFRLGAQLRGLLGELDGVHVHDKGVLKGGIVTFSVDSLDSHAVCAALGDAGINTSVSVPGAAMLDLPERGLGPLVRASVHYYNTVEELQRLVGEVARISAAGNGAAAGNCGGTGS